MPAPLLWRPDSSGGWMVVRYSNGTLTHHQRIHFDHLTAPDATLTYASAAGTEHTVYDTYNNYVALVSQYYNAAWKFDLQAVYVSMGPDPNFPGESQFQQLFGITAPSQVAGASSNASTPAELPIQWTLNFHTILGGRARIVLLSPTGGVYSAPQTTAINASGNTLEKLVAYINSLNCGVRGHDGGLIRGTAHLTTTVNRRIRRRIGQA